MNLKNRSAAFTLLELLVVLAILAIVTALAVRTLDRVEDQKRYESALRGLQELGDAVLGSPEDRAADGAMTVSGFVADMGRLPKTAVGDLGNLCLSELWMMPPGTAFDVRPATQAFGVSVVNEDPQVLVPGGWRGPYLRLPIATSELLDGWGNSIISPASVSPADPDTTGYARLRDGGDNPITTAGQDVRIVRILGANGRREIADGGYDRDHEMIFSDEKFRASIVGNIEVMDGASPATPQPLAQSVTVRVFGPSVTNPAQISVVSVTSSFSANPVTFSIPSTAGVIAGPRIVRAYLHATGFDAASVALKRSMVKNVTLRGGSNLLDLTIDR